jgi:hypothetical protein
MTNPSDRLKATNTVSLIAWGLLINMVGVVILAMNHPFKSAGAEGREPREYRSLLSGIGWGLLMFGFGLQFYAAILPG